MSSWSFPDQKLSTPGILLPTFLPDRSGTESKSRIKDLLAGTPLRMSVCHVRDKLGRLGWRWGDTDLRLYPGPSFQSFVGCFETRIPPFRKCLMWQARSLKVREDPSLSKWHAGKVVLLVKRGCRVECR